jgi:membrane fusion protein (multidrug efflux system)
VFVLEEPPPEAPVSQAPGGEPVLWARQQLVRLGERRGDFVAVLEGVEPGQVLVGAGAFKLRNNSPVFVDDTRPRARAPPAKPLTARTPSPWRSPTSSSGARCWRSWSTW